MADKKISELDAISGSATASDDLFLIVDASGSVTKKITRAELNNAIEQDVLSTVDINGGTIDNTVIGGTTPAAGDFTTLGATGNITVGGTVDGRDVAADGTKLDGIASSATANPNAIDNLVEDTSPQLGGNLDLNNSDITGTGNINVTGNVGIGGSPSYKLDVVGNARLNPTSNPVLRFAENGTLRGLLTSSSSIGLSVETSGALPFIVQTNGSERMRITSDGNVGISTTTTTRARLNIDTDGTNNSSGYGIALTNTAGGGATFTLQVGDQGVDNGAFTIRETGISGTTHLKITSSNGYLVAQGVYNLTTGSGANVFVSSAGTLQRSTSSRRYKNSIEDATHGLTELLALRPVTYKGNNDGDTVFGGLIAEEVHDAGLTEFVTYNDNDEPDALAYSNMVSLCIKAIQEQQATITALEARIAALEAN